MSGVFAEEIMGSPTGAGAAVSAGAPLFAAVLHPASAAVVDAPSGYLDQLQYVLKNLAVASHGGSGVSVTHAAPFFRLTGQHSTPALGGFADVAHQVVSLGGLPTVLGWLAAAATARDGEGVAEALRIINTIAARVQHGAVRGDNGRRLWFAVARILIEAAGPASLARATFVPRAPRAAAEARA
jgi:hypothetical protein